MADTPIVYVLCGNNCKYESMTKEQILAAIAQAIETGSIGNCDTGFITTVKTINGIPLKFFVGTQAAYNELAEEEQQNLFAIITDDTTKESILKALEEIETLKNSVATLEHYSSMLKTGIEKDDLVFEYKAPRWVPDPCGNYYSTKITTITLEDGRTVTLNGFTLRGEWINDNDYMQTIKGSGKIFYRYSTNTNGVRGWSPIRQIAGEGATTDKAITAEKAKDYIEGGSIDERFLLIESGKTEVGWATTATSARKAISDQYGNKIHETYALKSDAEGAIKIGDITLETDENGEQFWNCPLGTITVYETDFSGVSRMEFQHLSKTSGSDFIHHIWWCGMQANFLQNIYSGKSPDGHICYKVAGRWRVIGYITNHSAYVGGTSPNNDDNGGELRIIYHYLIQRIK